MNYHNSISITHPVLIHSNKNMERWLSQYKGQQRFAAYGFYWRLCEVISFEVGQGAIPVRKMAYALGASVDKLHEVLLDLHKHQVIQVQFIKFQNELCAVVQQLFPENPVAAISQPTATKAPVKAAPKTPVGFNEFWEAFNYKKAKQNAITAWTQQQLHKQPELVSKKVVPAAYFVATFRESSIAANLPSPMYPQGWINGLRWEDEDLHQPIHKQGFVLELFNQICPNHPTPNPHTWVKSAAYIQLQNIMCSEDGHYLERTVWAHVFTHFSKNDAWRAQGLNWLIQNFSKVVANA